MIEANFPGTFLSVLFTCLYDIKSLIYVVFVQAFVHVSTAFSNCDRQSIEEKFYPPKYNPLKLIRLTEAVDEPYLSQLTPL